MKSVLVDYASKHGSNGEIASVIARELYRPGIAVEVRDNSDVETIEQADPVVLWSADYAGQWQPAAVEFIGRNRDRLQRVSRLALNRRAAR